MPADGSGPGLDLELPVIQAPLGNATTPELVAAVSNAGGLGLLALSWSTPEQARTIIRRTRSLATRPFGVNLVLEWPQLDRLELALVEGVRIVSTFWGDPGPVVGPVHAAGGIVLHTAGSVAEAVAARTAGVDVIVVQGVEAGGHVRGNEPLATLVRQVGAELPGCPLVAAGGLATEPDVARVLAAGAVAAELGTRFLCTPECAAAGIYQQRILAAVAGETVVTTAFDVGWPDAPHRVLPNETTRRHDRSGGARTGGADEALAWSAGGRAIVRGAIAVPTRDMRGGLGEMALYAGESAARIRDIVPAGRLVRQLAGAA